MNYLIRIYSRNIYGVIGTLVFHILVFTAFLLAEVEKKDKNLEEQILIEFPEILRVEKAEKQQELAQTGEMTSTETRTSNNLTNAASNRLSKKNNTTSTDKFFNDEYQKELNDAKKLVSDVNHQLSKKKVNPDDIKMPVETTEGMNPDSIKNIIYSGESNIVYYLENRYHVSLPIPVYLTQGGGKIIIDIVVDQNGKVIQATPKAGQKIRDEQIVIYAQSAALRTLFNANPSAPQNQKGTIHYNFIAQ